MKHRTKIRITAFLTLFFLLFPPLEAGWQQCNKIDDAKLPHVPSDSTILNDYYKSKVCVTTDSGENWRVITIGLSSYYYGLSSDKTDADVKAADINSFDSGNNPEITGLGCGNRETELNENNTIDNNEDIGAATVVSYLVKITNYIKYNISSEGGRKSVKVTREKLTQGLYNLKFSGSEVIRTFNYYKLENENGTFQKEWFS